MLTALHTTVVRLQSSASVLETPSFFARARKRPQMAFDLPIPWSQTTLCACLGSIFNLGLQVPVGLGGEDVRCPGVHYGGSLAACSSASPRGGEGASETYSRATSPSVLRPARSRTRARSAFRSLTLKIHSGAARQALKCASELYCAEYVSLYKESCDV